MGTNETTGVTVNGGTELPDDKRKLAAAVQRLLNAESEYSAAFRGLLTVAEVEAGDDLIGAVYAGQEARGQLLDSVLQIWRAYRSEVAS